MDKGSKCKKRKREREKGRKGRRKKEKEVRSWLGNMIFLNWSIVAV